MYNKLRTIQKMLRTKILELEKLEKKYNKLFKKNDSLVKENDSLKVAFDSSQEENIKLKALIQEHKEKEKNLLQPAKRRSKRNDSSRKSNST